MDNWLLIVVGTIFLICIIIGIMRGAIKIVVSLAATILTLVIVMFATPYVSSFLYKVTPIKDMVQSECERMMLENAKDKLTGEVAAKISEMTGINFGDLEIPDGGFDWSAYGVKEKNLMEALDQVEFPRDLQITVIENSGLPQFLRDKLLENNNEEAYKSLGVTSFVYYIGAYLAKLITDIIAFLITFLIVTLVVRIAMYALNIIGDLPVIHGLNRLAGGILGMGTGLVLVWTLFMIITLAYRLEIGKECFEMIGRSHILTYLYEHNYILQWITKFH